MLNKILPALYTRLRRHSKLTQQQFAAQVDISRGTLRNYEAGVTRPDLDAERKLLDASRCSDLELAEILCELISKELRARVAIVSGEIAYRPATPLAKAEQIRQLYGRDLPAARQRALGNRIHTAQLMQLACERHHADLAEFADECRAEAVRRRSAAARSQVDRSPVELMTADPSTDPDVGSVAGGGPASAPLRGDVATSAPLRGDSFMPAPFRGDSESEG